MRKDIIYIIITIAILGCVICFNKYKINTGYTIIKNDTIYNYIIKDSIKRNIIIQDSIIYVIRKEMIYEIEDIKTYNDSSSIELFKQLTSEY